MTNETLEAQLIMINKTLYIIGLEHSSLDIYKYVSLHLVGHYNVANTTSSKAYAKNRVYILTLMLLNALTNIRESSTIHSKLT